jgi:O-antigen ligase
MKKYGQGTNQMQVVSGMPYFPMSVNDPHNAYTYIAFELGLVGLALYLLWLYQLWRVIELEPKVKHLLHGVFWAFVVMGVVDSGLALNAVAVSFVVISCSLLAKEKG